MVHKFKNKVDNFLFSEMPVDSMDYERKGGCFVTISKGVIITILFIIFGFILGLIVFYTTKHAYQTLQPMSLDEFIESINEVNDYNKIGTVTPKHYRIILNPILNGTQNKFSFNGNVWITITPNEENVRTVELDVKNLDIRADDVSIYRSRILSDSNFQMQNNRDERSAKLIEDDVSVEDDHSDMLMNSAEWIDSSSTVANIDHELQEANGEVDEESITTPTDLDGAEITTGESQSIEDTTDVTEDATDASMPPIEDSTDGSESPVTENSDNDDIDRTWDGLWQNDSMLTEPNPDDQTELEIESITFDVENEKLIVTLGSELRRGHYYIVKAFFTGNVTNDYGLVYTSYDSAESNDNFVAATLTNPDHTPAIFPCFNNYPKEVTFELDVIRQNDHQSVSVSKLLRSQKITNDWTLDKYQRTLPMKLNNFGFVVTNIEAIIVTVTPNLMLNSYFRPKLLPSITFIDSEIPSLLRKIESYTNSTYPLESINFIGLPSTGNNVIEIKQGLVMASESFFIAHDDTDKQSKALIVSHITAKLWFQPWQIVEFEDQEWINEALPLQLKLMNGAGHDNYFSSETMLIERMESMWNEQSFIEFNLKEFSKRRVDTEWISIAQTKGLYLLSILEDILTQPVYQTVVQRFFKSDKPANFIETLSNLTKELKIDQLDQTIEGWSRGTGFPFIHIEKNDNRIQIRQMPFGKSSPQNWNTRVSINNQTFWLQNNLSNFDVEDNDWLTVKSNGYFRVNYDENHWNTILSSLQTDHKILSSNDRSVLLDDAFNLAKFDHLNYSIVLKMLERWNEQETEYLPWKVAFANLEFVYRNSIDLKASNFDILVGNLTHRTYQNIVRSPLAGFPHKLKVLIKKWSCQIFALPDCVADAKKDFQNLIVNDTLQQSQRTIPDVEQLYCTVTRFGDKQNWNLIRNAFDRNNDRNYNEALVYSLGCSSDYGLLAECFSLLFDRNYKDYAKVMVRSMNDNRIGRKYALEYLYENFQQLYQLHGLQTLKPLLKDISTPYEYKMFQLAFSANTSLFTTDDKKTLAEIVNSIKSNLIWRNNFANVFNR